MQGDTAAGEQTERQRKFRHNQHAAKAVASQGGSGTAAGFQNFVEVHARGLPCGSAAEENSREHGGGDGEEQDGSVEADVGFSGKSEGRHERHDGFEEGPRERDAEHAAHGGKRDAFGEKLAEEALARGAEGSADGDFFLARGGASHQEVRDVGAGDEQDEGDGAEKQPEGGAHVAIEEVVFQRLDARGPAFIGFWVDFGDVGGDGGHVRIGLREGDAGLHARENDKPVEIVVDLVGREDERKEEFAFAAIGGAGRADADDGVEFAIHVDFAADDVRIGAEMVAPELVGEDDDVIFSGDGFVGGEVAAEEGLFFDNFVEIAGRHEGALDALGAFAGGDIEISVAGGAHGLEDGIFALPLEEIAGGGDVAFTGDFRPDDHELAGMRVGERGEQRGVDDAEDGGIGADAESQGEHGDRGEAGIFAEEAEAKAKVAQQVGHA